MDEWEKKMIKKWKWYDDDARLTIKSILRVLLLFLLGDKHV